MTLPQTVPIGAVVRIIGGGTPTRNNPSYYGGDIPWVTPKDMKSSEVVGAQVNITQAGLDGSAARLVPASSILIVVRSGVLKHTVPVALNRRPVAINQDMKALICSDRVDPDYLAHFIKARSPQILGWVRATTADNFPIDSLRKLQIPLPDIAEQRRIGAVLHKADGLRNMRRKTTALLDDLVQSIFLDMFGDPGTNPMGWPIGTIADLITSATYGTSERAEVEGDLPVLRMGNITTSGDIDLSDLKYMRRSEVPERHLVRTGDILFNRTNSAELVGKTALYRGLAPMAYAGYLVRLRTDERTSPDYLAAFLNTRYAKRVLRGMCKSIVGMANINAREVQGIPIAMPPLSLQQEFGERIRALLSAKNVLRTHLAELDALFASVQHRAFRSELFADPSPVP